MRASCGTGIDLGAGDSVCSGFDRSGPTLNRAISAASASEVNGPVAMMVTCSPLSSIRVTSSRRTVIFGFARNRLGHSRRKRDTIHRQRMPRRNSAFRAISQQQRPGSPHLFLQQPWSSILGIRFQRVRADEFRKIRRLVRRRRSHRPHLEQLDVRTSPRALPRGFRPGQSGSDNAYQCAHDPFSATSRIDVRRNCALLEFAGGIRGIKRRIHQWFAGVTGLSNMPYKRLRRVVHDSSIMSEICLRSGRIRWHASA